jgi:hypothetical protein
MAMLRSLAFVFALSFNVHPLQPPQPQAQATTESPCICKPQAEQKPNDAEPKKGYWSKTLKPDVLPVWIGGLAALLASIAGLLTLGTLKEQSRVGLLTAEAAKQSADIATNSERAWLITEVTFSSNLPDFSKQGGPERSVMIVQFKNAGRSPAEITRTQVVSIVRPAEWQLPETPTYGKLEDMYEVHAMPGEIIPAGEERMIMSPVQQIKLMSPEQKAEIMNRKMKLYCYGRVEYKDLSGTQRTTQFGYCFYVRENASENRPEAMYRFKDRAYNYTT